MHVIHALEHELHQLSIHIYTYIYTNLIASAGHATYLGLQILVSNELYKPDYWMSEAWQQKSILDLEEENTFGPEKINIHRSQEVKCLGNIVDYKAHTFGHYYLPEKLRKNKVYTGL